MIANGFSLAAERGSGDRDRAAGKAERAARAGGGGARGRRVTPGPAPEPVGRVELLGAPEPVGDLRPLRQVLGCLVGAWFGSLMGERAAWAVSELAGNAIRHGGGLLGVRVYPAAAGLVVEVRDGAPGKAPVLGRLDDMLAESGRGLAMLATVAVDLGWVAEVSEKSVWVVLDPADVEEAV